MLIVFDLDFTLWDAGGTWCDHTSPPYREEKGIVKHFTSLYERSGIPFEQMYFFDDELRA